MPEAKACMKGINMTIRTKIVATIGPASNSRDMLQKLVSAGMNVARLNFSHGNYEAHTEAIRNIRSIARMLNRPVGILLDLQGPKIRVGKLNVQFNPQLASRFNILSVPYLLIFDKGELMENLPGAMDKQQLMMKMANYLY